jgi:hypothetical protein
MRAARGGKRVVLLPEAGWQRGDIAAANDARSGLLPRTVESGAGGFDVDDDQAFRVNDAVGERLLDVGRLARPRDDKGVGRRP